jgi:outer membrane biosynthesis protein TonB
MSLIDEALKRAELEAARRDGLRGGPYPWILEKQPRKSRRWMWAAVIVAIAAVAAGGLVWFARKPAAAPAVVTNPESKIQNPASKIELETVEVAPPPKSAASQPVPRTKPEKETKSVEPAARPAAAPAEPARSKAPPAEARAAGPAESKAAARGSAEPNLYAGEFQAPDGGKITLEGIVYSESNPVALINGKVLPPGAVVEEFTIVSIQPDRVELKGRGTSISITLK